jgi:hypothetical protein
VDKSETRINHGLPGENLWIPEIRKNYPWVGACRCFPVRQTEVPVG